MCNIHLTKVLKSNQVCNYEFMQQIYGQTILCHVPTDVNFFGWRNRVLTWSLQHAMHACKSKTTDHNQVAWDHLLDDTSENTTHKGQT